MNRRPILAAILTVAAMSASPLFAEPAQPLGALAKMPVTEVTIFKDGHALMLHSGKMPVDKNGNVTLDYLPAPAMGTFWSASAEKTAKLTAVTASQHRVFVDRTALTVRELLEANVGADVELKMYPDTVGPNASAAAVYTGTIVAIPERSVEELEATSPPNTSPRLPQKGSLLLLKTNGGTRAIDINRVQEVTFARDHKKSHTDEELRNLLTMKLQWDNNKPAAEAEVNMMYLQKGIRWIPSYKIILDGNGNATVKLQATLINELHDLNDVTANLVVGVPSFAYADQRDPIALQQTLAQLSQHFNLEQRTNNMISNATMTQYSNDNRAGQVLDPGNAPAPDLGPELAGSRKSEDLFIFTLSHVTLKKGDRMVVPINEFKLSYKDVYKLDLPFTPPPEVWRSFPNQQQAEIARLANAPKFMHVLRITNSAKDAPPLTTAPAMILRDDKVLAQAMMTYTPVGAAVELNLTTAIDITVRKTDKETRRTPNDQRFDKLDFTRIDLEGKISLTNRRNTKVDLEITRNLLGQADSADNDGKPEMLNLFEDRSFAPTSADRQDPYWWGWYNWPSWWTHFNGVGRITWKTTLDPGKSTDLTYNWHYYWH